ncbi:MAG: hypothetical protein WBY73_03505 [Candidatus Acidiferrales bacterium]
MLRAAVAGRGNAVGSLERFTQNQRIIEEFVEQWLGCLPSTMARLAHVAMLRDLYTGLYSHVILEQSYSKAAIHESLLFCHEELFEKMLESSFQQQESDLRKCLANRDAAAAEIARRWLEAEVFRCFVPFGTPRYLGDLFVSNLRVILAALAAEQDLMHSGAAPLSSQTPNSGNP